MADELKPCPFCGGEARSWYTQDDFWCAGRAGCVNDDCGVNPVARGTNEESAVKIWNTRAAVTDEQFALAVHNGEAWQRVRTCRNLSRTPGWLLCSECGAFTKVTDATSAIPARGCGNCGAKVVE